jgi:hypothetical protein
MAMFIAKLWTEKKSKEKRGPKTMVRFNKTTWTTMLAQEKDSGDTQKQ